MYQSSERVRENLLFSIPEASLPISRGNDLSRDLGPTKSGAALLTSRLKEWNLLKEDCKVAVYRKRHERLKAFMMLLVIYAIVKTLVAYLM